MTHQPNRFEAVTEVAAPTLDDNDAPPRRFPRRAQLGLAALLLLATAGTGIYLAGGRPAQADAPPPIPDVTVSAPLQRAITEWDDYTGRFEASQAIDIRPRVSGQLVSVHVRDGDVVRKGQLLYTIDQRPFQAALAEARARAAAAETQVALARSEYARAARLLSDEAISREEVDALRAAAKSGEAAVAAAQAAVRSRQLDLEFTQIRAPATGRISDRRVDVGNLVSANDTLLTTLLALDPIYFSFDGSEALYLKAQRRDGGAATTQQVEIRLQDESGYNWRGKVDFTDNAIDPGSGTMRGRAVIANPDYFLVPGLFGNMRLTSGGSVQALLVPDAAVRTDQARKVVFVVGADGIVAARAVEPGPMVGGLRSIRNGLKPEDRVIIKGVQFAMPGGKVNPRPGRIDPPAQLAAAAPAQIPNASQATLAVN
ncbi:efflux RND transporter periplasmic adaptor subunit [Sandaracinobacter neustonicus]|uniref:Efflux RND transporter periplasmic adaptor subunit n=1 Tax=Sandaracinobacter neustonicus TaxID=1715348 RepID=A0A501XSS2_9SPHN|nr:efflux RND transporter periplasmic adaptor subunit [Sandaracinobacter neustonicus]TPE63718.1 efflux RND transporter periplasmic adaptor subunit [Sandaracinobacter neustonicus]